VFFGLGGLMLLSVEGFKNLFKKGICTECSYQACCSKSPSVLKACISAGHPLSRERDKSAVIFSSEPELLVELSNDYSPQK
jgi:hypothetical protein